MEKFFALMLVLLVSLTAGCAKYAVNSQKLENRTAFTLGLDPEQFKIYNRIDEGTRTQYSVKTDDGRVYDCVVGGTFSILGPVVSDAICREPGQQAKNPLRR